MNYLTASFFADLFLAICCFLGGWMVAAKYFLPPLDVELSLSSLVILFILILSSAMGSLYFRRLYSS